jgi:hypothetical protein
MTENRVPIPSKGKIFFLFFTSSRQALGPNQSPIQWVPGVLSQGVKHPGREIDHPSLRITKTNTEERVKNILLLSQPQISTVTALP